LRFGGLNPTAVMGVWLPQILDGRDFRPSNGH